MPKIRSVAAGAPRFASRDVEMPDIATDSFALAFGKSLAATNIFSALDVDSTITKYQIKDPSGVGTFKINGSTPKATSGWITVTASQLASLAYVAGSRAGSETIQIKAFDGTVWGNAVSVTMTVAKTVSITSAIVAAGAQEDQPLALHQVAGIGNFGAGSWAGEGDRDRRGGWGLLAAHG